MYMQPNNMATPSGTTGGCREACPGSNRRYWLADLAAYNLGIQCNRLNQAIAVRMLRRAFGSAGLNEFDADPSKIKDHRGTLPARGSCSSTKSKVLVSSTARRRRNQVV